MNQSEVVTNIATRRTRASMRCLCSSAALMLAAMYGPGASGSAARVDVSQRPSAPDTPKPATTAATGQDAHPSTIEGGLPEIVVTAQKRPERLQDVPISAKVVSGVALKQQNFNSLPALTQIVTSVNVSSNPRGGTLYIRGIGSGQNQSFDQSVGTFIDGMYVGRAVMSAAGLFDLERIEILKGPQTTYFGNNAIAGALNIITRTPGNRFEADSRVLYGEDGQFALEGAAGGALNNVFGLRVAATYNGGDGWIRNVHTDEEEPRTRNSGARATLTFKPGDEFNATAKYEHGRRVQHGAGYLQMMNCPPPRPFTANGSCAVALAQGVPVGINDNRNSNLAGDGTSLEYNEYALRLNYVMSGATLTSLTGYYNYGFLVNFGLYLPTPTVTAHGPESYRQFSQEIRLTSAANQRVEYLFGAYFQADRLQFAQAFNYFFLNPIISVIPPLAPLLPFLPIGQTNAYAQHERSSAVFGSLTWNIDDALKLTLGVRGSWVRKSFGLHGSFGTATSVYGGDVPLPAELQSLGSTVGIGQLANLGGNRLDRALLPSATINYKLARHVMTYASYAKGFKAGGFNGADTSGVPSNLPFGPEHVDAYEIGLKSTILDNHLLFNLDIFRSDYRNLQTSVNVIDPRTNGIIDIVGNAGKSRTEGVELETGWVPIYDLRLMLNAAYVDAINLQYSGAPPTMLQQLDGQATQDLSGRSTPFAPHWSGSLTANYGIYLGEKLRLVTEASAFYSSQYFLDITDDPLVAQARYVRLDARLSLEDTYGSWTLAVIGKNLTDRNIITYGQGMGSLALGSTGIEKQEPRNFAVQATYHW